MLYARVCVCLWMVVVISWIMTMLISRKMIIASFFSGWFLIILHNNDKDDPAQENDDDRDVYECVEDYHDHEGGIGFP